MTVQITGWCNSCGEGMIAGSMHACGSYRIQMIPKRRPEGKVTIAGPQGCGKSIVASIIHNALTAAGYDNFKIEEVQT